MMVVRWWGGISFVSRPEFSVSCLPVSLAYKVLTGSATEEPSGDQAS